MRGCLHLLLGAVVGLGMEAHMLAEDVPERESVAAIQHPTGTARFDLYQGYFIVAHGSVGPLKNLNFFLDTGTIHSVVDSRVTKKLNLPEKGPSNLVVMGGKVLVEDAILPSVDLGPVHQSSLQVTTTDLSFFKRFVPVRIDAIVGLDMLRQEPFVIDYTSRVIHFGSSPVLGASVPLRLDGGLAVFDAEIDHSPVHLLFDTGAASLVLFAAVIPGADGKVGAVVAPEDIGNFKRKQVRLRTLKLGAQEFREEPALLALNPKPSQLDFDGVMSPAALGISKIFIDLQGGVLAFSR